MTARTAAARPRDPAALPAGYPTDGACDALLVDGGLVHIRPICPADAEGLRDFHDHLSSSSVYRRFFGVHPHLQVKEIEHFTDVDYRDRFALVAEVDQRLLAVVRYDREAGVAWAEVALVVADAWQGRGLATLLLEHLAAAARHRGVFSFFAETLGTNYPMREVFRRTGFACEERSSQGVVDVSFPIRATERYLEAVVARDLQSVHAWLEPLVTPSAPRVSGTVRSGGLGVVCQSAATEAAITAACHERGISLSTLMFDDNDPVIEASDLVAYLAAEDGVDVIVLAVDVLRRPHRFVSMARVISQRKPILVLSSPDTDGGLVGPAETTALNDLSEQGGLETIGSIETLTLRAIELLAERQAGIWQPPLMGALPDLAECDAARGRAVLDAVPIDGDQTGGVQRLDSTQLRELLDAYGLAMTSPADDEVVDRAMLTIGDDPTYGLHARLSSLVAGANPARLRLLPLTDQAAETLVAQVVAPPSDTPRLVEAVLRCAHLVEEQTDLIHVELIFELEHFAVSPLSAAWVGPRRTSDDDPFVRRLPYR